MSGQFLQTATVAAQVTERLRSDIINKNIEPGSKITIKEISERYGVSNMPVREAFRTLEGEKLLEINAYKGATVLCINESFVRDTYDLLRALECLIYETVLPEINEEILSELRSINNQIKALLTEEKGFGDYIDLNTAFHGVLISRYKNSKVLELYSYHHGLLRTMRKSYIPWESRIRDVIEEHDALIDALESKDIIQLKAAVDTHANQAMKNFIKQYSQSC